MLKICQIILLDRNSSQISKNYSVFDEYLNINETDKLFYFIYFQLCLKWKSETMSDQHKKQQPPKSWIRTSASPMRGNAARLMSQLRTSLDKDLRRRRSMLAICLKHQRLVQIKPKPYRWDACPQRQQVSQQSLTHKLYPIHVHSPFKINHRRHHIFLMFLCNRMFLSHVPFIAHSRHLLRRQLLQRQHLLVFHHFLLRQLFNTNRNTCIWVLIIKRNRLANFTSFL